MMVEVEKDMKKNDLTKVIGISFLVFVVLSWIIKAGSYSSGVFTAGELSPVGIYDIVKIVLGIFGNYTIYGIIFLLIGALYGVMNKTGVYSDMIKKFTKHSKGSEKRFLVLSIVLFAILGSISGFNIALFIIVPFFVAVIMSLGYDKLTALLATVGSIIVGNIGSTYGFEISGYLNLYYGLKVHGDIITKVIFLAILILITILFVTQHAKLQKVAAPKKKATKKAKKDTKEEKPIAAVKLDIPLYEVVENKKKKSVVPLAIVFVLTFVVLIVGLYNFKYAFNIDLFEDLYTSVTTFKVADFPIFQYLMGSMNPFGAWNLGEIGFVLVVACFLIGWLYSLKMKEILGAMKDGMKEMVWVAVIAIIANIIMYLVLPSSSTGMHSNIYITMSDFILGLTKGFNWLTAGLSAFLGSFFYNDFKYLIDATSATMATMNTNAATYPALALLYQAIHGIVMLVAPVSLMLMAGLAYLKVSFKEWFLYIWKFLLQLLIITVLVLAIVLAFV